MGNYTNLLFADPNLLSGAASILDFANTLFEFNTSDSDALADLQALKRDWMQTYEDLSIEHQKFLGEHSECRKIGEIKGKPVK